MSESFRSNKLLTFLDAPIDKPRLSTSRIWLVWLALTFLLGVALGLETVVAIRGSILFYVAVCSLLLLYISQCYAPVYAPRIVFGFLLFFFLLLGIGRGEQAVLYNREVSLQSTSSALVVALVSGEAKYTQWYKTVPVHLVAIYDDAKGWKPFPSQGKLQFRLDDSLGMRVTRGDSILARISVSDRTEHNPNSFDYGAWGRMHGEYFLGRVEANTTQILGVVHSDGYNIFERYRLRLIARLEALFLKGNTLELVKTMCLGARQELSTAVRSSFNRAGVAHILALSGLHVGFLYGLLAFFMRIVGIDSFTKRLLREGIPLLLVWCFVLVAGASSSLLRAALMLTVYGVGRMFFLHRHPIDILALSSILIVSISPFALYDVGFQLSFSALLGIILLYPYFSKLLQIKFVVLRWLLKLMAVSFCAQIATLPVLLYVFGTLPFLSLLTNVVAIPLVTIIVPVGLILAMCPDMSLLTTVLVTGLEYSVKWLLWVTETIAELPLVSYQGFKITAFMAWLLGLAILAIGVYSLYKRRVVVVVGIVFFFAFLGAALHHFYYKSHGGELVVYQQNYGTCLSIREGCHIEALYSRNATGALRLIEQYTRDIWFNRTTIDSIPSSPRVRKEEYGYSIERNGIGRIFIPLGKGVRKESKIKCSCELLLLSYSCRWSVDALLQTFVPAEVVLSATYPRSLRDSCIQQFSRAGVVVYDIATQGCYTKQW